MGVANASFRVFTTILSTHILFILQVAKDLFREERATGLEESEETFSGERLLI